MTLTRRDIARRLRDANPDLDPREAAAGVDAVVDCVRRSLGTGSKVMISGFGTFELRERAPRRGVDPSTGKPMTIRARKVVAFRGSPVLHSALADDE